MFYASLVVITVLGAVLLPMIKPPYPAPPPPPAPVTVEADVPPPAVISATLDRQAKALIARDKTAWLAPIDERAPDLVAEYGQLYDLLTSMGVTALNPVRSFVTPGTSGHLVDVTAVYAYCWQVAPCPSPDAALKASSVELLSLRTAWDMSAEPRIVSDGAVTDPTTPPPHPWLAPESLTVVGSRVTIIGDADQLTGRNGLLPAAEQAAAVADSFVTSVRPERYVVYMAGPDQWLGAPSGEELSTVMSTSMSSRVVVVDAARVTETQITGVLRHAFGHVVSTLGGPVSSSAPRVLGEGRAEYVAMAHAPFTQYPGLASVRMYLQYADWTGAFDAIEALWDTHSAHVAKGIGYLFWVCVDEMYGVAKANNFADELLRSGTPLDEAARSQFGVAWSQIESTCSNYVLRHTVA
jgi:hypothetical protein